MIFEQIPDVKTDFEQLRAIARAGFVVALNHRWIGPEYLRSEFPKSWRDVYEQKNYFMLDPIYYWTRFHTGTTRWSEVNYPDPLGIQKQAATFGMVYGATACIKNAGNTSFISAARSDREFTDKEISSIHDILHKWEKIVTERPVLTPVELETLQCLRRGLDQHQTAEHLNVSPSTIKKRLRKIRRAFNAKTIAQAIAIATEKNYFQDL